MYSTITTNDLGEILNNGNEECSTKITKEELKVK